MPSIFKTISLLALASASPVYGASDSVGTEVEATLIQRADRRCAQMLVRFLRSPIGVADPAVRKATSDCYVAEARLLVRGHDRALLAAKPALHELPAHKLSQDGGLTLDPYRPLAGMRFVAPGAGTAE